MSTVIKIQTTESRPLIIFPVFINKKGPFDFVLDTGAAMSIMTEELASIIGIEGMEVKDAMGAAGKKIKVQLGRVALMSIGEIRVEDVQVGIMKELPKCVGHGVLGYNFLKEFILTIDYRSNLLTFTSPTEKKSHNRSLLTYMPLRLARPDRPIILVDVLINAQEIYQFVLDTGASQTIVSPAITQKLNIKDIKADSIMGAGGAIQSSAGILKSISVGEVSIKNIAIIVADIFSALSQAVGAKIEGILGFNFLRNFELEIDYPNKSLRFKE